MSIFLNERRAKQLISFEGMERRWGLLPTDIDGYVEYIQKLYIFFEGKVVGTDLPEGQRRALESICESHHNPYATGITDYNRFVFVLIFEHNTNPDDIIMMKDQIVVNVYNNISVEWRAPSAYDVIPKFILNSEGKITVLNALRQIEDWCHKNKIIIGKEKE